MVFINKDYGFIFFIFAGYEGVPKPWVLPIYSSDWKPKHAVWYDFMVIGATILQNDLWQYLSYFYISGLFYAMAAYDVSWGTFEKYSP